MAEVVNLRRARKAKRRSEDEAAATANRAKFGATKAERSKSAAETTAILRTLDGAKRER
ncbi:DUF4169 family protein [Sphingomonas sp. MMS24-J45]|uniref:DUF4169 family protein n=1 Tax=Sphingomonas sp. MMS24-J45 TaxID=3238806 RepID=UPI0038510577